jgi:hypothetical protein
MSNSIAAVLPSMLQRHHGVIAGVASVAGYRGLAGSEAYGADKGGTDQPARVPARPHRPDRGAREHDLPRLRPHRPHGSNHFPMPFIIDAGQAARSICDGPERERTEIAFPTPMALL